MGTCCKGRQTESVSFKLSLCATVMRIELICNENIQYVSVTVSVTYLYIDLVILILAYNKDILLDKDIDY